MATSKTQGSKRLVIVESPKKARTIAGYLGPGYDVEASVGHIRDLPQPSELPADMKKGPFGKFAVDVENGFEAYYVVDADKKKKVSELKKALKDADELYLATDEDREGEAIAWHLLQVLEPKVPVRRMVFHEITREAIQRALQQTRDLDERLVDAQETRRILDRLYGYEVSPVLWRKVRAGLSAGRVQSVATRLVVERERERMAFRSASYWDVTGVFAPQAAPRRRLQRPPDLGRRHPGRHRPRLRRQRRADRRRTSSTSTRPARPGWSRRWTAPTSRSAASRRSPTRAVRRRPSRRPPSSRRPAASCGSPSRQTMRVAQSLYEDGYITYMRTDSVQLSDGGHHGRPPPGRRPLRPGLRAGAPPRLREQVEERPGGARGDPARR